MASSSRRRSILLIIRVIGVPKNYARSPADNSEHHLKLLSAMQRKEAGLPTRETPPRLVYPEKAEAFSLWSLNYPFERLKCLVCRSWQSFPPKYGIRFQNSPAASSQLFYCGKNHGVTLRRLSRSNHPTLPKITPKPMLFMLTKSLNRGFYQIYLLLLGQGI